MSPTNAFLCLSFSYVFFQNFVFERHGIEEFQLYELHVFQGITVLKTLVFKKKPPASNDVCSYIRSSLCVCGCTREGGIHRSR